MPRPLTIDATRNLPPRAQPVSPSDLGQIYGGCVAQGGKCNSPTECCPVPGLPPGDYVLCYFYRSVRIVTGYCTRSSVAHGS
jgi:hypothetical protein